MSADVVINPLIRVLTDDGWVDTGGTSVTVVEDPPGSWLFMVTPPPVEDPTGSSLYQVITGSVESPAGSLLYTVPGVP